MDEYANIDFRYIDLTAKIIHKNGDARNKLNQLYEFELKKNDNLINTSIADRPKAEYKPPVQSKGFKR